MSETFVGGVPKTQNTLAMGVGTGPADPAAAAPLI